jgi:Zinc finger, C2H2 type
MEVNHQFPKTWSSRDHSCGPWPFSRVACPPLFDLELPGCTNPLFPSHQPTAPPLTVNLSQLFAPPGDVDQYKCITPSFPSPPSLPFSHTHPSGIPTRVGSLAIPPGTEQFPFSRPSRNRICKRRYASSSDLPFDSSPVDPSSDEEYYDDSPSDVSSTKPTTARHARHASSSRRVPHHSGPGVVGELDGHSVLRYPDSSYRCVSIVTASGKVSQYTQKSERPPDVGQPCGQTFRGRDEIVRHLKTTQWHKKLNEKGEPLVCDVCGQELSRMDALTRHMKRLHPSTFFIFYWLINKALTSTSTTRAGGEGAQVYNSPQ